MQARLLLTTMLACGCLLAVGLHAGESGPAVPPPLPRIDAGAGGGAAGEQASGENGSASTGQAPGDSLPGMIRTPRRRDHPDICPVCGKTRTACNNLGIKYRKLMAAGRYAEARALHVCPVQTNLGKLKARPAYCPVCGHKVEIPVIPRRQGRVDMDADRCPHPVGGQIKFFADIVVCPNCGFSALVQHFTRPQPPEVKAWVKVELSPAIREIERGLVVAKFRGLKLTDRDLVAVFSQETMPDTVRCENALALYTQIKAHPTWRVRLALQCAWAYRRQVCAPLFGAYQTQSVRRIFKALEAADMSGTDLQKRVAALTRMYRDHRSFTYLDRQVMRVVLAGYYDRLGLTGWARACLQRLRKNVTAMNADGEPDLEPWIVGIDGELQKRRGVAMKLRRELAALARVRLELLRRETEYLRMAADLIRQGLRTGAWRRFPEAIPAYLYYTGECERRLGNFTRARIWLKAAQRTIIAGSSGMELFAPRQLKLMQDYMRRLGLKAYPRDPRGDEERQLAVRSVRAVELARAQPRSGRGAHMSLRGDEPAGASARHRNEVKLPHAGR